MEYLGAVLMEESIETTVGKYGVILGQHSEDIRELKQISKESAETVNKVALILERFVAKLEESHTPDVCPIGKQATDIEERVRLIEYRMYLAMGGVSVVVWLIQHFVK